MWDVECNPQRKGGLDRLKVAEGEAGLTLAQRGAQPMHADACEQRSSDLKRRAALGATELRVVIPSKYAYTRRSS